MDLEQNFRITGTGSALPTKSVSAEEVDQRSGKASGWTRSRVGITTRFECTAPQTLLSLGSMAVERALKKSGCDWSQIDLIIDCSTTKIRPIPCNAAHIQSSFFDEASGIPCFDIESTCLGFIVAVHVANALFTTGLYRNIIIVAMEGSLKAANWAEIESAALLGDGAAAVVLSYQRTGVQFLFAHETFSDHLELCKIDGGGHQLPAIDLCAENRRAFLFHMDGPAVFRIASEKLPLMVNRLLQQWQWHHPSGIRDVQVVPHQASPRALSLIRKILGLPEDRFHVGMENVGNMAAASIPWMLDSLLEHGTVSKGAPLMLLGTSAGYSQAALIFTL